MGRRNTQFPARDELRRANQSTAILPSSSTTAGRNNHLPEAEFLDVIRTKVLGVFLLTIHSHLY
jgi:hypothetical protein